MHSGSKFLKTDDSTWSQIRSITDLPRGPDCQDEVQASAQDVKPLDITNAMDRLLDYFSDWTRLKKSAAVYNKVAEILQARVRVKGTPQTMTKQDSVTRITVDDLEKAELAIVRWIQSQSFADDVNRLSNTDETSRSRAVGKASSLYALDPYLENGILRVGGRLSKSSLSNAVKHPIIMPKKGNVTNLIIQHEHKRLGHVGRNHVLASIRNKYWVIRANSAVRSVLNSCVTCRRMRGPTAEQKMADLPTCRLDDTEPPFSYTGVDYFGPFVIREGQKDVKRYGVVFTCLVSRAVHLEIANTLETDSFLHALRRFIARRGNIKQIRSDNGTNFTGAENELKRALAEMDQSKLQCELRHVNIDWVFNPPAASNMGGAWERMIRSIRKVLTGLLQEHGCRLDTESFQTLLCEVEAVINSRPLTTVSGDADDPEPLTPSHVLTGKSCVTAVPPGVFQKEDVYLRRRWRRVQYLSNLFWTRWRSEYLLLQQPRQKWKVPQRNMSTGDVVLIRDDTAPRYAWPLGLVMDTEPDEKGFVRAVKVKTQSNVLRRPVNKLVLLVPCEK